VRYIVPSSQLLEFDITSLTPDEAWGRLVTFLRPHVGHGDLSVPAGYDRNFDIILFWGFLSSAPPNPLHTRRVTHSVTHLTLYRGPCICCPCLDDDSCLQPDVINDQVTTPPHDSPP